MRTLCKTMMLVGLFLLMMGLLFSTLAIAQQQTPPTEQQPYPPQQQPVPLKAYFYLHDELVGVEEDIPGGGQMTEFIINKLLEGPTEEQKAQGYITYIPQGVKLLYSTKSTVSSEYSVTLSSDLLNLKHDQEKAKLAMEQIYRTLKEASQAQVVKIFVDAGEGQTSNPQDAYELLGIAEKKQAASSHALLVVSIIIAVLVALALVLLAVFIPLRRRRAAVAKRPAPTRRKSAKVKR